MVGAVETMATLVVRNVKEELRVDGTRSEAMTTTMAPGLGGIRAQDGGLIKKREARRSRWCEGRGSGSFHGGEHAMRGVEQGSEKKALGWWHAAALRPWRRVGAGQGRTT